MKKLLVLASVLLILVLTLAACEGLNYPFDTGFPFGSDQTTDQAQPAESRQPQTLPDMDLTDEPVEEATKMPEPEIPTEELTAVSPDFENPTEEYTTAEEEITEEATTRAPEDPLLVIDPDFIASQADLGHQIASAGRFSEFQRDYVRLTIHGDDPWFYLVDPGSNLILSPYMAISYRTNSTQGGEFFIGSDPGPHGNDDYFDYSWTGNEEWNLAIIDLREVGLTSINDNLINYCRMDFFKFFEEGAYFDIEYVAFFDTAEYAAAYNFELHKAPMWTENQDVVVHQSFDELQLEKDGYRIVDAFFTPGQSAGWNNIAILNDFTADALLYWGWIAYKGELGQFGYQINDNDPIYNSEWAFEGPDHDVIVTAAQGMGGDSGIRMRVNISLAGLKGTNSVRVLYKNSQGEEVCLNEFTVILPDEYPRYEDYNVPANSWTVSGHCPQIVPNYGHGNSAIVAAGGLDIGALLHQGAIGIGEIDLSKYSKVVISYGIDNSSVTQKHYDANAENRIMLVTADTTGIMSPDEANIIASVTYTLQGWAVETIEIDLSGVNYNGPVYVTYDTLPGTFMLIGSIEFIGSEIPQEQPEKPEDAIPEIPGSSDWVVDLSTIEGNVDFEVAGYTSPVLNFVYGDIYNFGEVDLSQYSKIIIEYSYDGESLRGDHMTAEESFTNCTIYPIIGFTALEKSFGYANVVNQDAIDNGIYATLEYTPGMWAADIRTATISTVDYKGPLYLSVFSPYNTLVTVSAVIFVK